MAEGTHADNAADKIAAGNNRKLSAEQRLAIWDEWQAGAQRLALAEKYGVSVGCIKIVIRERRMEEGIPTGTGNRGDNFKAGDRPGELNGRAKLTNAQAADIRERYARGGIRQVDLANEYGVSQLSISNLVRGHTYVDGKRPERQHRLKVQDSNRARAKVTAEQVREIRKRHTEGAFQIELAEEYGVLKSTIWQIVNFKTFRDIE